MKTKIATLFFLLSFLLTSSISLLSHHISGGYMEYECLGNESYQINLNLYRNCADQTAAPFDNPLVLTIYQQDQNGYTLVENAAVSLDGIANMTPTYCNTGSTNLCQEFGEYFYTISLPTINESYFVVYQRCCRAESLTNLAMDDTTGTTIFIEITPPAQTLCNTSPELQLTDPIQVCKSEPFSLDLQASDMDGDVLIYTLCPPLKGGGNTGSPQNPGDPQSCTGVAPNPACPPPFDVVAYAPNFNETAPLGLNSFLSIDPETGMLTGTAENIGTFLMGICIDEYRNGVLLSQTRKEFHIEVTEVGLVSSREPDQLPWTLFPQPAREVLFIKPAKSSYLSAVLHILNHHGQIVRKHQLLGQEIQALPIGGLREGLYFTQIEVQGVIVQTGKLLIVDHAR